MIFTQAYKHMCTHTAGRGKCKISGWARYRWWVPEKGDVGISLKTSSEWLQGQRQSRNSKELNCSQSFPLPCYATPKRAEKGFAVSERTAFPSSLGSYKILYIWGGPPLATFWGGTGPLHPWLSPKRSDPRFLIRSAHQSHGLNRPHLVAVSYSIHLYTSYSGYLNPSIIQYPFNLISIFNYHFFHGFPWISQP